MVIKQSHALRDILKTRKVAASDLSAGSCTAGYDNDGSTGLEIFVNGAECAAAAAQLKKNLYWAIVENDGPMPNNAYFLMGDSEEEALNEARSWDEDPR